MKTLPRNAVLVLSFAAAHAAYAQSGDPNLGRNLAANCAPCHGTNGRATGGMASLAGRQRAELVRALQDFRDGKRPATVMQQLAKGYTDAQIEALSDFLSRQKP